MNLGTAWLVWTSCIAHTDPGAHALRRSKGCALTLRKHARAALLRGRCPPVTASRSRSRQVRLPPPAAQTPDFVNASIELSALIDKDFAGNTAETEAPSCLVTGNVFAPECR
jgi:hypothetical protein